MCSWNTFTKSIECNKSLKNHDLKLSISNKLVKNQVWWKYNQSLTNPIQNISMTNECWTNHDFVRIHFFTVGCNFIVKPDLFAIHSMNPIQIILINRKKIWFIHDLFTIFVRLSVISFSFGLAYYMKTEKEWHPPLIKAGDFFLLI